ncbi:MAG: hypothetical protein PCFJNLEI_00001 [Verrucomicrobiae bacterium]|nr:hypothetical protein [Verrucomicrobiae bacterium]
MKKIQRLMMAGATLIALTLGVNGQEIPALVPAPDPDNSNPVACNNSTPGGPTEPPCECPPCPLPAGGVNPFGVFGGNRYRAIRDLEVWGGVGEHALTWERHLHSRALYPLYWFGDGQQARHSYQWEFLDASGGSKQVNYPDGTIYTFTYTNGTYVGVASCPDVLVSNVDGSFTLTRRNGWRYNFKTYNASGAKRLESFTDSQSNVYTLAFTTNTTRVTQITEPAGRWLKVTYTNLPVAVLQRVNLATVSGPPPSNQWTTLTVSSTGAYRYFRYSSSDWSNISEIEFVGTNGVVLTGSPCGTSPAHSNYPTATFDKAFDGDTNTFFQYAYKPHGFTGLDLGAGIAKRISQVRFFPPPEPSNMSGGVFAGMREITNSVTVIQRVDTSDGRSVVYGYTNVMDYVLETEHLLLTRATYSDGTQGQYGYVLQTPGVRPLLAEARDPRGDGRAAHIKYVYTQKQSTFGVVSEEQNGVTGDTIARAEWNGPGNHSKVIYGNGKVELFRGNSIGMLTNRTDGLGRVTKLAYNQNNQGFLIQLTDPLGRVTTFTNDVQGRVLGKTHPDSTTMSWTRDSLGRVLTHTDELSRTTTYTRDSRGRVTRIDYPDSSFETFTYNAFSQVTSHQLRNGGTETATFDARGLKTDMTDAEGNVTTYSYNTNDLVAVEEDARGNTTSYLYNDRGQVTKITHADSSFRTMAYDQFGNRTNTVDELGHATAMTYDEFNRVVTMTDPLGRTTTTSYAEPGGGGCGCSSTGGDHPTEITLPSGKTTSITYDVEWQKTAEAVGAGTAEQAVTQFAYDKVGNLVTNTDPRGKVWVSTYDNRNRRVTSQDPLGNTATMTYDAVGNLMTSIRPDGGVTTNAYDALNRLVWTRDPKNQVTQFTYDAAGNMTSLTDARGNTYSFTYDLLNRRTRLTYLGGSHEDYVYDAVGNLATYTTRAGQVRTYTYDNRNRETLADWSDSTPDVSRTYDAAGRLLTLSTSVSALSYSYDAANQLLSETSAVSGAGGSPAVVSYTYDSDGNRATLTYPDSTVVTNGYTARNQLASETIVGGSGPLVTYTYDLAGNRVGKALGNGSIASYVYDDANRLLSLIHSNSSGVFAQFDYTLNSVGNRTSKTQTGGLGSVTTAESYTYDAVDQITGVDYATNSVITRSVNYNYDGVGNRTSVSDAGTTSYTANNLNQYTQVGGGSLTYDNNGNLVTQPGWTYAYDAQNRLVSAASNSVTIATFAYDARNRCVVRTISGVIRYLTYEAWNLIEERDNTSALLDKYIHGALVDEVLIRYNGSPIWHHHDGLGSVTHLTDNTGTVVESYRYDVYGDVFYFDSNGLPLASSAFDNRFGFTGREWLGELGFYDYRNRMYAQTFGRFFQTDPLSFDAGDINLYRYCANNPPRFIDSYGLTCTCTCNVGAIPIYLMGPCTVGAKKAVTYGGACKAGSSCGFIQKCLCEAVSCSKSFNYVCVSGTDASGNPTTQWKLVPGGTIVKPCPGD